MLCKLLFIAFSFIPTYTEYIPKKCPRYRYQWLQKSKEMGCIEKINGTYHCFLDQNGNITEMCFEAFRINPDEEGCPLFQLTGGVINIVKPFDRCATHDRECPRKYHRYYYTDELYKYADCIPLESAPSTEPTQKEATVMCPLSEESISECQCCGVIIASFLVLLWIVLLQRKQIIEDIRQVISFYESLQRSCQKETADKGENVEQEPQNDDSGTRCTFEDSGRHEEQHASHELLSSIQPVDDYEQRRDTRVHDSV